MTTMDLLGKLLQGVVGLGAFGVVMALLLAFLDRPEDKPRPESWRAAIALGLRPRLIIIGVLVLLALLARLLYGAVPWMTQGLTNALLILVPLLSTAIGLAYAVFIDKSRGERVYKMLVFMPMAISFVGASIIWNFMYAYRGPAQEQIGLINQLFVLFGGEPQQILQNSPWNTLALIVVMIWIQTGFAMVVLSAAIKGVPTEQLEAAEIDGANPWQRFRNVTVPSIRTSIVVVVTTISIATLKVFDIVRTMTAGNFDTSVIANEMYTQAFRSGEPGRGAALALVLFIMVLPIVVYNIRVLNQQKAIR